MGLGKLIDATSTERRHRLLGEDMAAAVRRPSRAQLGAHLAAPSHLGNMLDESLNHRPCHDSVEIATSEVAGLQQVKQQSGRRLCPEPAEHEDTASLLQVEGPLCFNAVDVVSESRRAHAKLNVAALVHGGWQTHHHAVNATCHETIAPESLLTAFNTSALRSSSGIAAEENEDPSYFVPHVEQTRCRTATIPSEEAGGLVMPIFVKHFAGEMTLNVSMNESPYDLMQLYAQRTQTKLDTQYFIYQSKRLEPHDTWLSCGLERDTTVHVCTRLLGGAGHPNLQEYINSNKHKFVTTVSLPNGRASLQMTPIGCQFLSSWIRCFTAQFIQGRSWNGKFELVDFKFVEGHVRPKSKGKVHREPSAMEADIIKLVDKVRSILNFSHIPNVVSSYPPYVQSCMKMMCDLVGPLSGPFTDKNGRLSNKYRLLLDTLVCCMTSKARESLIIELYRKYEGACNDETTAWEEAIKDACKVTRLSHLSNTTVFSYFIGKNSYSFEHIGAFTLLRDVVMHATDRSGNPRAPKLDDGIELMIPATLEDFLPAIIKNLIKNGIDISTELSAAISCACDICDAPN